MRVTTPDSKAALAAITAIEATQQSSVHRCCLSSCLRCPAACRRLGSLRVLSPPERSPTPRCRPCALTAQPLPYDTTHSPYLRFGSALLHFVMFLCVAAATQQISSTFLSFSQDNTRPLRRLSLAAATACELRGPQHCICHCP